MIRLIMIFQFVFFFMAGTQIVQHEVKVARAQELTTVLVSTPVNLEYLSNIEI